jgi:hypothetical protein
MALGYVALFFAAFAPFLAYTSSYLSPRQGLTLVHFSAQLERFLWDRGCA